MLATSELIQQFKKNNNKKQGINKQTLIPIKISNTIVNLKCLNVPKLKTMLMDVIFCMTTKQE